MTFDSFAFDENQASMMNIYDDMEPFDSAFTGNSPPESTTFFGDNLLVQSMKGSVDFGVEQLRRVANVTLQPQRVIDRDSFDDFESDIPEQSRKRRRKVSAEEMREKNRVYAKHHRAEKKRRQEELLKRNEQLEKENRHLRRMLMQLGISPSPNANNGSQSGSAISGFRPVQSIKNVGNTLVKGVKGGIGFMIPGSSQSVRSSPAPIQGGMQVVQGVQNGAILPQSFQIAMPIGSARASQEGVQSAPQFIIPTQPIAIQNSVSQGKTQE